MAKTTCWTAAAMIAAALAAGCGNSRTTASAETAPNAAANEAASTAANGARNAPTSTARLERGKYLVTVVGCNDCHTPLKMGPKGPEPDMARFLSGHPEQMGALEPAKSEGPWMWAGAATNTAFAGPWGVSYAANLTPDKNTGLGIWTEDMFIKAIRTGRHMGTARDIMPPMPWPALRNATDEDLKSMYAYLQSLTPIANHVPDAQPPAAAQAN